MFATSTLSLILVAAINASPANETVMGRWCDKAIPGMPKWNMVLTLVAEPDGDTVMRMKAGDGSSAEYPLEELGGEVYAKIDSKHGDKYRIVKSTGQLQLLDNDGLIRTATRLENTPQPNECKR